MMTDMYLGAKRIFVWALMSAMGASALRGPPAFVPSGVRCFSRIIPQPSNLCMNPSLMNSGRFLSLKTPLEKPVRSTDRNSCRRKSLTMQQSPDSVNDVNEAATYKTAIKNTGLAVSAAVAFGIGIGAVLGVPKAIEFFSGYVVEESLSVDNLFVFILLFEVRISAVFVFSVRVGIRLPTPAITLLLSPAPWPTQGPRPA
jgi:hypothetical protein